MVESKVEGARRWEAAVEAAKAEVAAICRGTRRWTMCIPVQPTDSDIVISAGLQAAYAAGQASLTKDFEARMQKALLVNEQRLDEIADLKEQVRNAKAAGVAHMKDAAETLWVVLANVSGGDWTKQTQEWQDAAARWRDNYFAALRGQP